MVLRLGQVGTYNATCSTRAHRAFLWPFQVTPGHREGRRTGVEGTDPTVMVHGSPCQSAPQPHGTWLTPLEWSPAPRHMAHPIKVLPSPAAHGSPHQNAPQSHSSACQGFLLSLLPPVRHLSPNFSVRNDTSECGFLSFLGNKMPSWVWWYTPVFLGLGRLETGQSGVRHVRIAWAP